MISQAHKHALIRAGLNALRISGGHKLLAPLTAGLGAVLMLHQVSPEPAKAFDPNGILRVTPQFLDEAIRQIRSEGYDIVSLDEARLRLLDPAKKRPFVTFTLDDGYRDNLVHARPVFARHKVPYCVYVATAFADGSGDLWWSNLEAAIASGRPLTADVDGVVRTFDCSTVPKQQKAWRKLYWWLRSLDEDVARAKVRDLCDQAGIDASLAARDPMTWDEVAELAADPLCTIGAHTVNHYSLAKLDLARCRNEILAGRRLLEQRLGRPVRHFSYPYGSHRDCGSREFALAAEAGFDTAVTTSKGLLFPGHRKTLTALPRLSLNGEFQDVRLLSVLLGGAPFAVTNGLRHLLPA